jgi:outer membrane protein assembly factor BamB
MTLRREILAALTVALAGLRRLHNLSFNSDSRTVIKLLAATILAFAAKPTVGQPPQQPPKTAKSWSENTLTDVGFSPGVAGAKEFLLSLVPSEEATAITNDLVLQLGNELFSAREAAMLQLANQRHVDLAALRRSQKSDDAEVRWRARKLLVKRENATAALLAAALSILESEITPEVRELSWNGAVLANDRVCMTNLSRFLATAYKDDKQTVLLRAKTGSALTRIVAIETLRHMLDPKQAADLVRPMLQDPEQRISLGVARILGDVGERECLRTLASLTAASDAETATTAVWILESLTGNFPDSKTVDASDAELIAKYWQQWCDKNSATVELRFPVGRSFTARGNLQDGMLCSTGSVGKIFQTDRTGQRVWEYDAPAWSAEKLRNGNILIASFDREEVFEVTLDNRIVWRWRETGSRPIRAKPLPNGNVLVADYDGMRAVELDKTGQKVWEVKLGQEQCFDAERLENGNTLVATPTSLIEFRPNQEKVRVWPQAGRVNSVQVLSTGNFLVANHGLNAVMELNRQGDVLWRHAELGVSEAFQAEDGSFLLTSDRRSVELSPDRKQVRQLHGAGYGSARK